MTSRLGIRGSIAITAALALTLGACGGDDDGGGTGGGDDIEAAADTEIGQALTAELMSESEDSPVSTEEEARCVAGGIVSNVGEDRLTELGVTADNVGDDIEDVDFTPDEVSAIVDSMFDCVDITAALTREFEADFGAEGAECLADGLGDDTLRELMASSFLDGDSEQMPDEFFQEFMDIAAECDLPLG